MIHSENRSRAANQIALVKVKAMEERDKNGLTDVATFDSGAGAGPIHNRSSAAIDVLKRALLSPNVTRESVVTSYANESGSDTTTEDSAPNAVTAAAIAARSFLDTTSSVYVLDADTSSYSNPTTNSIGSITTNPSGTSPSNNNGPTTSMPKLFGCWNFLHQAMNEIERFEDERTIRGATNAAPSPLLPETRLLAEFAVKVARRSDDLDRRKVTTCVENFCSSRSSVASETSSYVPAMHPRDGKENDSHNESNDSQSGSNPKARLDANHTADSANGSNSGHHDINILLPHLVRANAEIREIVTGRIATFSFNEAPLSPSQHLSSTVFADPIVVETFCRFLAANAVSNGAERLRRFLSDWIIPGATVDTDSAGASSIPLQSLSDTSGVDGIKRQRLSPGGNTRKLHHRLPPYSLACVLYHVAAEAETIPLSSTNSSLPTSTPTAKSITPLGTIDVLQRLSLPVMANVLLRPVLHDALQRKQLKRTLKLKQQPQHIQHHQLPNKEENDEDLDDTDDMDDMDDRIIAMGLRAILKWCSATDLSLAQTKHIGSKVQVNLSGILGEALQTSSPMVMNALADLIEDVVERHVVPQAPSPLEQGRPKPKHQLISLSRMTQTRYLMQVPDEASFLANVSEDQLHTIETKELSDMLSELSVNVERQRLRFPSFGREATATKGNSSHGEVISDDRVHSMGHSLARIATAVCLGISKVGYEDLEHLVTPGAPNSPRLPSHIPRPGLLELLSKCASHPSVAICGIVLPVITPVLKTQVGLATQWLQTLQRRAIIPHHPNSTAILSASTNDQNNTLHDAYIPLLAASDICFVEFEEFVDCFRETVLADALKACYTIHPEYYLASCTAAIEEFCVGDVATEQTSFHLEAALFCMTVVAGHVLSSLFLDSTGSRTNSPIPGTKLNEYLLRCTDALAQKPKSLNNPLTMAQACRFIRKYAKWYSSPQQNSGTLDISADLTLFILVQCASTFPDSPLSSTIQKESGISPYSEAAKTLRCLLCNNGKHFLSNKAIAALGAGWEATFAACNRGRKLLTLEDRKDTCIGICHVLAALPKEQQQTSLMALALASIACLEAMTERAESVGSTDENGILTPILDRASDEIIILVTTAKAFTDATAIVNVGNGSGRASFVEPSMMVLRRAWPTITIVASKYSFHDSVLEALKFLFLECMPMNYKSETSLSFLQNMCCLAQKVIKNDNAQQNNENFFSPVLHFVDGFAEVHGSSIDRIVISKQQSREASTTISTTTQNEKMYKCIDSLARKTLQAMTERNLLGNEWKTVQVTQGNGQSATERTENSDTSPTTTLLCQRSGLAPFFSFLRTCTLQCPAFLLHVLASRGPQGPTESDHTDSDDRSNDDGDAPGLIVFRKALGSAVSSIIDVEADISINAIAFLESVVTVTAKSTFDDENDNKTAIRRLEGEFNLSFQTNLLAILLQGICGILQSFVIADACRLLYHILSKSSLSEDNFKVIALGGLSEEHFFLGNRARGVVYELFFSLFKQSNTASPIEKLESMMTDIWRLHRYENIDAIKESDAVRAFCVRHGSNKVSNNTL